MKLVAYYRVSTERQGRSGLGLEAQRAAVEAYATQCSGRVLESFTEIESGKRNDRPELDRALLRAKVTGATLVIAKLDRLSRDAAFLLKLQRDGVRFVAADMPDANTLTVGILAVVAQAEREAISTRTKDALAAVKARGGRLGNPNGAAALRRAGRGNAAALEVVQAKARERADNLASTIADLKENGVCSLGAIAEALNKADIKTAQGKQWHKSSVRNLLQRLAA
jgi:DNA invertase Pin-like site-specific DNA recombinase